MWGCFLAAAVKDVGREYDTKKQLKRKEPSKKRCMRASKRCHMNRIRVLIVAEEGRIRTEAP